MRRIFSPSPFDRKRYLTSVHRTSSIRKNISSSSYSQTPLSQNIKKKINHLFPRAPYTLFIITVIRRMRPRTEITELCTASTRTSRHFVEYDKIIV